MYQASTGAAPAPAIATSGNDGALKAIWRIVPFLFICYVISFLERGGSA